MEEVSAAVAGEMDSRCQPTDHSVERLKQREAKNLLNRKEIQKPNARWNKCENEPFKKIQTVIITLTIKKKITNIKAVKHCKLHPTVYCVF